MLVFIGRGGGQLGVGVSWMGVGLVMSPTPYLLPPSIVTINRRRSLCRYCYSCQTGRGHCYSFFVYDWECSEESCYSFISALTSSFN